MTESPLPPRAARVFYNVADAWLPPGPGAAPGGGDVDLLPYLPRHLHAPDEARRIAADLLWIEWLPRLLLRSQHGFSWLPRPRRAAWLRWLESSRWRTVRVRTHRLHALVDAAYRDALRTGNEGARSEEPSSLQQRAGP
ncbi:MAG: hypothetical protein QNK03_17225 [Myxococcota bacterium]|nr:hypothetical protein [Myxococcota bacterium]